MSYNYIKTPIGIAQWANLQTPDARYNKYKINVVLTPEDAKSFNAQFEEVLQAARKKAIAEKKVAEENIKIKYPARPEKDKDKNLTGNYVIKFAYSASYKSKRDDSEIKNKAPWVVNNDKKELDVVVGNGSRVVVVAEQREIFVDFDEDFEMGSVSQPLRLAGVQVIELKEYIPSVDPKSLL